MKSCSCFYISCIFIIPSFIATHRHCQYFPSAFSCVCQSVFSSLFFLRSSYQFLQLYDA